MRVENDGISGREMGEECRKGKLKTEEANSRILLYIQRGGSYFQGGRGEVF